MLMAVFDANIYRLPGMGAAELLAVSRALLTRVEKDSPDVAKKESKRLHAKATGLQAAWIRSDVIERAEDARPYDVTLDRCWGTIHSRLLDCANLATEKPEDAALGASILLSLFSNGLAFLKLPYDAEWAESEKLLKRIDDEGHAKGIEKLCDPVFLKVLRKAHADYGRVLGLTEKTKLPEVAGVGVAMADLNRAIGQYVRKVAGTVDEDDEATIKVALDLLSPIADARARALERSKGAKKDGEGGAADQAPPPPDAPIPSPPG